MKVVRRGCSQAACEVSQPGDVDDATGLAGQKAVGGICRNRLQCCGCQTYLRNNTVDPESGRVDQVACEGVSLLKRGKIALCRDLIDAEVELVRLCRLRAIEDIRSGENVGGPNLIVDARREVSFRSDLLTGEGKVAGIS